GRREAVMLVRRGERGESIRPARAHAGRGQPDGDPDLARVAPDGPAVLREDGDLAGDRSWIALAVPDIGIAGDDRQRDIFAAPSDEERHAPAAVRRGIVAGAVDAEVRPLHGDRSASEETARDRRRLREPRDARARRSE